MTLDERIRRALEVRHGEGRTLLVMASFLLLNTANTTVLSAAKNGLFLSIFSGDLIPHAVISAALLTAFVAIIFTGAVGGVARRRLGIGLSAFLALSVVACRTLFEVDPRTAFVVYLWLSTVQVLMLTHAWDYASGLMTGRQAKRLLPLIGMGASAGAIVGGATVAPAALGLGTSNLLWISVGLIGAALPLLWVTDEPARETDGAEGARDPGAFFARASEGIRAVRSHALLRLLALGLVALTITGTLIDLQLKFLLQEMFTRDRITAIYGLLAATVGLGTLLLQLWASRVVFPRLGVSFAAVLHGAVLTAAAGGLAVLGGLTALVVAQALDDILQFSLQQPVEQVSLLPFPGRVKSAALATLGGVLRPLSKASAGGIALVARPEMLPFATVASAAVAFATYAQHRRRYMAALEDALARHAVDLTPTRATPLVVDVSTVAVIERALADEDAGVAIFATSLLEQLPSSEALPRLTSLLAHPVPEVRAEAAMVLGRIDAPLDFATGVSIAARLAEEDVPYVVAALLETIGRVGGVDPGRLERFTEHADVEVRRAALVALGRLGWPRTEDRLRALLSSPDGEERVLGAAAVGDLGAGALMHDLAALLEDGDARPAALEALTRLGADAIPLMTSVLGRRELPLPTRRSVVTALASVGGNVAREALLELVEEPALGPAAITSLGRMRAANRIEPIEAVALRGVLTTEMQRGLRLSAAASVIRSRAQGPRDTFVVAELRGLEARSVHRVMKVLALSYEPSRIDAIATALASDDPARRSNALELLEGTISKGTAVAVMRFMDVVADGMPLARVAEMLADRESVQERPAEALLNEPEWWSRALALHVLGRDDEISTPGLAPEAVARRNGMIPLIEKVMLLKGSEFFKHFPGADLAGIAAITEVVHVDAGRVVFEQGDQGDAFYLVVKGAVTISRGEAKLATLGPREGFGEMSILDKETRSATATAAEDTTLLSLDRDSFDRIIEQNPVVARGVYRVLTERLRNTLAQVAAG